MVAGGAVPTLTYTLSPSVTLTTNPTCTTTAASSSAAGTYPITCSGAVGTNDTFTYVAGTMTVTPQSTGCALGSGTLNPNALPGCNFDLSIWSVQLPIGPSGNPTTIINPQLETYTSQYFQTDPTNGSLEMYTPETNCTTTANSSHCRTEMNEVDSSGVQAVWSPSGTNTMTVTLDVTDDSGWPVIGQIHFSPETLSNKPLVELYYNYKGNGHLEAGVEQSLGGGNEVLTDFGPDPTGKFTYMISYSNNLLCISVNGGTCVNLTSPTLGNTGVFKVGDYGQGTVPATVEFYAIKVVHQ
jgi:hypothetical protein